MQSVWGLKDADGAEYIRTLGGTWQGNQKKGRCNYQKSIESTEV